MTDTKHLVSYISFFALLSFGPSPGTADIVTSKHNLSKSGPGPIKATLEDRICIFCHTPHNATPQTPLWNRTLEGFNYKLYESTTLGAFVSQPTGPTRLCLSCHDGQLAVGQVVNPSVGIAMGQELTTTSHTFLGLDISDDHPVNFDYLDAASADDQLVQTLPDDLLFYTGELHCSTCHDAHDDTYGMFLAADNKDSQLCLKCHNITGWAACAMATKTNTWNNAGTNPWPRNTRTDVKFKYANVAENGCQNCHDPHNAPGAKRLLNSLEEEQNCSPCHNGNVAAKNVMADFDKISKHNIAAYRAGLTANAHDPTEYILYLGGHVECVDCHNPHAANDREPLNNGDNGEISGKLELVSGIDQSGAPVYPATYEYEVCFKCHSHNSVVIPLVPRAMNEKDTLVEFNTSNPSFHPVIGPGNNSDVPSIPSEFETGMQATDVITCTTCHDSDDTSALPAQTGAKGPHGSDWAPLLRQQYVTDQFTQESLENFRLCYQCHDRTKILNDVIRFSPRSGGHAGHLNSTVDASCAACHDPHGVQADLLPQSDPDYTGDHQHLINFDLLRALPVAGRNYPIFTHGLDDRSGSCTLVCHDSGGQRLVTHTPGYTGADPDTVNSSYP